MDQNPAHAYYDHCTKSTSVVDQWLALLRKAWAAPDPEGLALYPEVSMQDKKIPGRDGQTIPITVFTPPKPYTQIMIHCHGGGWISPTSGRHQAWAKCIAAMGNIQVISVEYRLAPEHPFPAALYDCLDAYQYAREQIMGQVCVVGDSAGGNLALGLGLYCVDHDITPPDKILSLCPVTDLYFEKHASIIKYGWENRHMFMGLGAFERFCYTPNLKDWKNPYASPIYGELSNLPKTLILAAEFDPCFDDNVAFANAMNEAGGDVSLLIFDKMPHTFFTQAKLLPKQAEEANQKIIRFIDKGLI